MKKLFKNKKQLKNRKYCNKINEGNKIYFNYWKYISISFIILFYLIQKKLKNLNLENINLKVCICTPAKEENKYAKEYITHYKNYGVDKIYLYDNNNINGEHFEEVINEFIKSGFVEIVNFRGKKRALFDMMNDCYKKNYLKYDWLIFYEFDEYIHLKNKTIKTFLGDKRFNRCQTIKLNWILHTDNNLIYYDNRTLKERFPVVEKKDKKEKLVKSILKGGIPNIKISCPHRLDLKLKSCNGYGKRTNNKATINDIDYENYYIDHYSCKSTEEFAKKLNKGDAMYLNDNIFERLKAYFDYNEITKEKIDYFDRYIPFFNTY